MWNRRCYGKLFELSLGCLSDWVEPPSGVGLLFSLGFSGRSAVEQCRIVLIFPLFSMEGLFSLGFSGRSAERSAVNRQFVGPSVREN